MDLNELKTLIKQRQKFDYHYYIKNESIITDDKYDQLVFNINTILDTIEDKSIIPYISSLYAFGKTNKVKHIKKLLSLDNTLSQDVVSKFVSKCEKKTNRSLQWFLEPKVDGLSLSLIYKSGILVSAATRGNKSFGEDVLSSVVLIDSIPKHITIKDTFNIRGEAYLTKSNFQLLCNDKDTTYSNPRNASSGLLRNATPDKNNTNRLSFIPYSLGTVLPKEITTQKELIELFHTLGFTVDSYVKLVDTANDIDDYFQHINAIRSDIPYDIDGIVIKVNDLKTQDSLGDNGDSPNWALAKKFSPKEASSTLLDVTFNIGKTGLLTPVAHFDPINIGGVFITKATIYNSSELIKLGLCIGDTIIIQRAGDVIPKIKCVDLEASTKTRTLVVPPENCPSCNTKLERFKTSGILFCPNMFLCPSQIKAKLSKFCSKEGFNILGLGVKTVVELYDLGYIRSISDIFNLYKRKNELLKLDGFSEKSCNKLFACIEKSKRISMQRFIAALSIPNVSTALSVKFSKQYKNITDWLNDMLQNKNLELPSNTLEGITISFSQPEFMKNVNYLIDICDIYN